MKPHDLSPRRSLTMGVCCTLSAALGLFISSGLAQDATAAQTSSKIDPTPYTVQERALNHRVMSRVIQTTDADGKSITKTNSYTELATGLHYLQDGNLGRWGEHRGRPRVVPTRTHCSQFHSQRKNGKPDNSSKESHIVY